MRRRTESAAPRATSSTAPVSFPAAPLVCLREDSVAPSSREATYRVCVGSLGALRERERRSRREGGACNESGAR